jgi:hypothetical protein
MKISLRTADGQLKFRFKEATFSMSIPTSTLELMATKKNIKYEDGSVATMFTMTEDMKVVNPFGDLFLFKGDYIVFEA